MLELFLSIFLLVMAIILLMNSFSKPPDVLFDTLFQILSATLFILSLLLFIIFLEKSEAHYETVITPLHSQTTGHLCVESVTRTQPNQTFNKLFKHKNNTTHTLVTCP